MATILRKHLDDVPLWRGQCVAIRQLVEDFARYLYLPRLRGPEVLVNAIRDGVALLTWQTDTFAHAESFDAAAERYRGLSGGHSLVVTPDSAGLLVKPDVARRQLDAETEPPPPGPADGKKPAVPPPASSAPPSAPRRFHGTVALDPTRVGRDAGRIGDEVIAHLAGLVGSRLRVTLEIDAEVPSGAPENVVRIVTENSRTLRFMSQ